MGVGEGCVTGRNVADAFPISVTLRVYMRSCGGIVVLSVVCKMSADSNSQAAKLVAAAVGGRSPGPGAARPREKALLFHLSHAIGDNKSH